MHDVMRVGLIALALMLLACEAREQRRTPASATKLTPPLRLVVLTDVRGTLEPCGCTRRSAGGLDRAAGVLARLRKKDPALVFLALGDLLFAPGTDGKGAQQAQAALEADAIGALLRRLQPSAIAPGPADFARGATQLRGLDAKPAIPLLGARAAQLPLEALSPSHSLRAGSRRLVISSGAPATANADLSIVVWHGEGERQAKSGADVQIRTGRSLTQDVISLAAGKVELAPVPGAEALWELELWPQAGPGAAWRATAEPPTETTHNWARITRHALDRAAPSDPEVRQLLDQVFQRINQLHRDSPESEPAAHAGKRAAPTPSYVGARTCAACHTQAYLWWTQTAHGRAYQTLIGRGRELDLDCVGCHVTGFDEPGGARIGQLQELKGVGCESCHGPGEWHVNNPRPPHREVQRSVPAARCAWCHDPAHSDDFRYEDKRALLLVPGHGGGR